jgi:hypothetical protein
MCSRLEGKVCVIAGMGGSVSRTSALASAREGAFIAVDRDRRVESAEPPSSWCGSDGEMVFRYPSHVTDPAGCQALLDGATKVS